MEVEQVYLKIGNSKLISFKKLEDGRIIGTGILNPLLDKLRLFTMLYLQSKLYKNYNNLARYKGMIERKGEISTVGNLIKITNKVTGQYQELVRIIDVRDVVNKTGWFTTLELEQDPAVITEGDLT